MFAFVRRKMALNLDGSTENKNELNSYTITWAIWRLWLFNASFCFDCIMLYYVVCGFFFLSVDDVLFRCAFVVYLNFVWELRQWFVAISVYMERASVLWWKKNVSVDATILNIYPQILLITFTRFCFSFSFVSSSISFYLYIYFSLLFWFFSSTQQECYSKNERKKTCIKTYVQNPNKSKSSGKSFWLNKIWPKLPRRRWEKSYDILSLDEKKETTKCRLFFFFSLEKAILKPKVVLTYVELKYLTSDAIVTHLNKWKEEKYGKLDIIMKLIYFTFSIEIELAQQKRNKWNFVKKLWKEIWKQRNGREIKWNMNRNETEMWSDIMSCDSPTMPFKSIFYSIRIRK